MRTLQVTSVTFACIVVALHLQMFSSCCTAVGAAACCSTPCCSADRADGNSTNAHVPPSRTTPSCANCCKSPVNYVDVNHVDINQVDALPVDSVADSQRPTDAQKSLKQCCSRCCCSVQSSSPAIVVQKVKLHVDSVLDVFSPTFFSDTPVRVALEQSNVELLPLAHNRRQATLCVWHN